MANPECKRYPYPSRQESKAEPLLGGAMMRHARRSGSAANAQRQPLEEVAQQLVAAGTVVGVAELAEQRAQLRLGHRELGGFENGVHVVFLQFEGHAQLLEDDVVGHRRFDWLRRTAVVLAALENHQAVKEVRHDLIRAEYKAFFLVFLEVSQQVFLGHVHAAEFDELDHLVVTDVEHVAHAAQYVVVNHGGQSWFSTVDTAHVGGVEKRGSGL